MNLRSHNLKKLSRLLFETCAVPVGEGHDLAVESLAERYERLRLWRNQLADGEGKRPYEILSNVDLLQVAAARPSTVEQLLALPGFGERKVREYGPRLLLVLEPVPSPI